MIIDLLVDAPRWSSSNSSKRRLKGVVFFFFGRVYIWLVYIHKLRVKVLGSKEPKQAINESLRPKTQSDPFAHESKMSAAIFSARASVSWVNFLVFSHR